MLIQWTSAVVATIFFQTVALGGDPSISNLATLATGLVTALITLLWLALASPLSQRARLGVVATVVGALALFFGFYRFERLSGSLMPVFEPRFGAKPWNALEPPSGASRTVDLERESAFDFPGFLGAARNARVDGVVLATDLEARPPELLWRHALGAGLGGFAVRNGFAATLEQRGDVQAVTLYEVDTGKLVWLYEFGPQTPYEDTVAGDGPRSTPAIADGMVFAQGVYGVAVALDGRTGEEVWRHDLSSAFGLGREAESEVLPYGRPGSPLVVDDRVIFPAGGSPPRSIVAFDRFTGERLLVAGEEQISMASPNTATLHGRRQIVITLEELAAGFDLETGEQLWEIPWPGSSSGAANVSQAVAIEPDRVLLSKGYGQGAALFRLSKSFEPSEVWQSSRVLKTKFTNVAIDGETVYGLSEGILEAVDLATGDRRWKGGRFGHGQTLLVGGVILVLAEDGEVVYVRASPDEGPEVLARFQALRGQTWNNFALAGDRLVVRNGREAAVYRLPTD